MIYLPIMPAYGIIFSIRQVFQFIKRGIYGSQISTFIWGIYSQVLILQLFNTFFKFICVKLLWLSEKGADSAMSFPLVDEQFFYKESSC